MKKPTAQDGPKAVFSEGEDAWHWLQLRFEALGLDILGVHETGLIPEAAFFSSATEVQALAAALGQLSEQQLSALADPTCRIWPMQTFTTLNTGWRMPSRTRH